MCVLSVPVWWDIRPRFPMPRFQETFHHFPRWGAGHGAIFPPITTATSFVQANLGQVAGPRNETRGVSGTLQGHPQKETRGRR